jgi:aldehyde dehydrogenase (NAD+)
MSSSPLEVGKLPESTQLFINNEWVDGNGAKFDTVNPRTEEVIASMHSANEADVNKAVDAAEEAFKTYGKSNGCDRRDMMLRLADLVEKHRVQLAELESRDNGKPQHVADGVDIGFVIECFRYYAGCADKVGGRVIRTTRDSDNTLAYTVHEPIGACGVIIPWNFPLLMVAWKLGPALAMGCTIVMKLSEKTPLSGLMLCHLIKEAGYPAGVVNMINGYGQPTGEVLARHMKLKKIAFTGSSAIGHKIVEMAGQSNLKKVTLELGGKSAMIICKDADLDQAATACHVGLFINMGQCCCASSRIYVHEDVHDAFVEKIKAHASKLRVLGDDKSDTTVPICDLGPQIDKIQFDKILGYIETGKKEGASLLMGGSKIGTKGYHIAPTIFGNVKDDMTIAKEEIFGPVMQLMTFKDIDEVVERANNSRYGLAAGVCSRDIGTALRVAKDLDAGTVWINSYDNFDMACPFGGTKESGWGREKSEYALDNYTSVKVIMCPIDSRA